MNADEIVQQAIDETGLEDFGAPGWRDGFDRFVDSITTEGRLTEVGEMMVPPELVGYLKDRLGIVAHRDAHPELAGVPVAPPIVIVGQGRTGTTILYDLLAQDPQTRVPRSWEVARPLPPPETATYETDPRIDEVDAQFAMVDLVVPGFRAMHPMGARLAQECVAITASDFKSMQLPTQYHVPSYGHWLLHEADMSSAYRWHRMFLEHLQSRHPARRWVLKSPGHIWCLDALLAEYPDALLVQTHRDPMRIIASISSLVAMLRSIGASEPTIPEAAAEFADYITLGIDRSVDARENGTVDASRVIDTQFADFMADPIAVVRAIYEHIGMELTPAVEQRMRNFLAANPQDAHGGHRYTWAETGLDEGEWRDRSKRYMDYFDVPTEALP